MNVQKLLSTGVLMGASMLASKGVGGLWKRVTGHTPPAEDDDDVSVADIVIYAAISGAVVALVRVLTTRRTKKYFSGRVAPKD